MNPAATGPGWSLYEGDCLDVLPHLAVGAASAVVMDPPYTAAGGNTNGRSSGADDQYWRHWFRFVWEATSRVLHAYGCGFIFSDWRMIGALKLAVDGGLDRQTANTWEMTQALVWDRESIGLGSPFRGGFEMLGFVRGPDWTQEDHGLIGRDLGAVLREKWPYGSHPFHGSEKPIELCRRLVRLACQPQRRILDPFAGSGTAGVAALAEGREYIGIEIEPRYLDIAAKRLEQTANVGVERSLFQPRESA